MEVFKFLGRLLSYDNSDIQAVYSNLPKAQGAHAVGAGFFHPAIGECIPSGSAGSFLWQRCKQFCFFGSERWNLAATTLKSLEGFQIRSAWHMTTNHEPRQGQGISLYPELDAVLEEVPIWPIALYVDVWRQAT